MAESGESGGKASDLFLGVVDLFAVILPGALFTGLVWKVLSHGDNGKAILERMAAPEFVPKWLVLLVLAYIVGHFLFALGAWIMDPLYNGYYKDKPGLASIRRRADRLLNEVLGEKLYDENDNRLTWSESLLRFGGGSAMGQLDRLEADSKFFRSLAVVAILSPFVVFSPLTGWIAGWGIWIWGTVTVIAVMLLPLSSAIRKWKDRKAGKEKMNVRIKRRLVNDPGRMLAEDELGSRFAWTDAQWLEAEALENQESKAKFLLEATLYPAVWTLVVAILAIPAVLTNPAHRCGDWIAAATSWGLGLLSAWRYMELRAKRLMQAYYFAIALHKSTAFGGTQTEKK